MVGQQTGDYVTRHRCQVQLRRRQVGVPEHPLDVRQRQLWIAGHAIGSRVPKVMQRPVGTECRGRPAEHRPGSVIGQRPERTTPRPPQRVISSGGRLLTDVGLVEAKPHKGVWRRRELLDSAGSLANHRDQLLTGVDVAAAGAEQLRGTRAGRHPQRHERPVTMRAELGEHAVEHLIGDAARDPLDDSRPVQAYPLVAKGLHRVVMGIRPTTATGADERKGIDHRAGADIAMEVVEDPQHRL